jgi:hypothetical protein
LCAIACLSLGVAHAAVDCSAVPSLTSLQKRIAAKAAEGSDALRRFVAMRQHIYQFDIQATMDEGVSHYQWLSSCARTG